MEGNHGPSNRLHQGEEQADQGRVARIHEDGLANRETRRTSSIRPFFPVDIPRRLIKLFSWHGETVLDPFAGTGTTAVAAIPLGRKAVCVDQSAKYADIIRRECGHLKNGRATAATLLDVHRADSRDLSFVEAESVSLVVSSPPYWNKAHYGSARANLGRISGYRRFLQEIRPAFEECFRVLQPGRKCCLVTANVNQHTDRGLLTFPLAADFGAILRDIGFVMVTEIVWSKDGTGGRWGSANGQRPIFGSYPYPPNFLFKNVPRVHSGILEAAVEEIEGAQGRPIRRPDGRLRGPITGLRECPWNTSFTFRTPRRRIRYICSRPSSARSEEPPPSTASLPSRHAPESMRCSGNLRYAVSSASRPWSVADRPLMPLPIATRSSAFRSWKPNTPT